MKRIHATHAVPTGSEPVLPAETDPGSQGTVRAITAGIVLAASLLTAGCQPFEGGPNKLPPGTGGQIDEPVTLHEGDALKFFYPGAPEYNTTQKIRSDGKISLPLINEIQAAGKSIRQLKSELSSRYKSELQNSDVVVILESSGSPIFISGGVKLPGPYTLSGPTTLLQALAMAGNFTEFGDRRRVRITRVVNGKYQSQIFDMSRVGRGEAGVVYVRGGDVIEVAE